MYCGSRACGMEAHYVNYLSRSVSGLWVEVLWNGITICMCLSMGVSVMWVEGLWNGSTICKLFIKG